MLKAIRDFINSRVFQRGNHMPDTEQQPVMRHNSSAFSFGVLIAEVDDIEILRQAAIKLWEIIDDIDTTDDMARENNEWYRKRVQHSQKQRFEIFESDGHTLFLPPGGE